ncbi:hypothetical protein M0R72_02810 [Candidatus Pacearchaeota archaeon]|nr:hypothetical protein [Candidatus Pacearchaeota archaeon]
MQTTNNYVPTIIERGARRATRYVCSGERSMRYYKKSCHRSYRRVIKHRLHEITVGLKDIEEYNDEPGHCKCTSWDIW